MVAQTKQHVNAIVALWDSPAKTFSIQALVAAASQVLTAVWESESAFLEMGPEILALLACLAAYGDAK